MLNENLLLEIGLEEMPAPFVTDATEQFRSKIVEWFRDRQIDFQSVEAYSTPRRLAVFVTEVAEKQADRTEEARGPAKNIAVDKEGNWSKAAQGFAKGQGVSVEDLIVKEMKGKEYVFAKKFLKGQSTSALLPELKELITSMSFPKSMRWGSNNLRFIRPIRWLLAMYGDEVIPMTITGVRSGRLTYGHRFLGDKVAFKSASEYPESLLGQFVIADPVERKNAIRQQLATLAEEEGWVIPIDEDLLEEVNNLVEYPTALYGKFDEKYLELPKEVLMTSMREHQRYFPVEDQNGELKPYFVTVRNGDHNNLDKVARGNEKVLNARLSDASFFYEEDRKQPISSSLERLEHIVFQETLGTLADKVDRIQGLSEKITRVLQADDSTSRSVKRAAEICKFDLVTHMVNEFSELQGVMGEKYARLAGEEEAVAKAVSEHYRPRFKGDPLPAGEVGAIVAVADKLDTIAGCFVIGLIPSGSQDPYALRRNASGIARILIDRRWHVPLESLVELSLDIYEEKGFLGDKKTEVAEQIVEFFRTRLKTLLQENDISYDVIDAVLSDKIAYLDYVFARSELLNEKRTDADFKPLVEALSRVTNIAGKADLTETKVDPELFVEDVEKQLYEAAVKVSQQVSEAALISQPMLAYQGFQELEGPIHAYFDNIMVMAEDDQIRRNRLNQMKDLAETIRSFANFNALVL
ncbi:MAG TPA: glycine--tRNA ligase subunit beta [Bacillales bacterium]|nr:glycine--tRNA ligase subunit beta [Bacillales bacterium]